MNLIPSKQQWKVWSLPAKLGAIGTLLGAIGILLTAVFFVVPYLWHPDPEGERIEELVSVLELRANRVRDEVMRFDKSPETLEFVVRFSDLHQKHIAALRARNFALAHEELIEIWRLEVDWERKQRYSPNAAATSYSYLPPDPVTRFGPIINSYVNGEIDRARDIPPNFFPDKKGNSQTISLYNSILHSAGFRNLPAGPVSK